MMFAQAICSDESGTVASPPKPAESVSTSGQLANICSAVGLLRRFWLQINNARFNRFHPQNTLPEFESGSSWPTTASLITRSSINRRLFLGSLDTDDLELRHGELESNQQLFC